MHTEERNYIIHPHKFALWLFLLTLIMIFGGLTSAFIVSKSFTPVAFITHYALPPILKITTVIVILSSLTLVLAQRESKRNNHQGAMLYGLASLVLALLFLVGQFFAFRDLTFGGFPFVDASRKDNSVSFFYMFLGLHGLHIVAGIVALLIALIQTSKRSFRPGGFARTYELIGTFWHFLSLLWIYLYVFLIYNQA